MPRQPSNPLPQFITSSDLGLVIAAELHEYVDVLSKQAFDTGATEDLLWRIRIQTVRNAAVQLDNYCKATAR
jgi:hypothetical protein